MANGLDKLEKLFSKRRPAPSRDTTASNIYGSAPSASAQSDPPSSPEPVFPQAPFVRPKANANRMRARNEFLVSSPRSYAGTNSSSSRSGSWRLSSSDAQAMSARPRQSSYSSTASFHIPSRNTSLLARRHDRKPGGLIQLHLPGETKTIIKPPLPPPSLPKSPPPAGPPPVLGDTKGVQKCLLEALPIYPAQRFETPPPSDQDEFRFPSPPSARGRLPSASLSHFTPDASPDMIPKRDSLLSVPRTSSDLQRKSISAPPSRRATSIASSAPLLKDDWRDSYVPDVDVNISPKPKSVFQDPPVQEFLTLTDEDIAEIKIKAPSKPPTRLPPPPPVLPPNGRSPAFVPNKRVSTMQSPSLAPDEVAAFQAARIAKKYDFDFLYIVNFWPSHMSHLHRPSDASKHSSHSSSTISSATSSSSNPPSILYSPTSDCATTKNSTPRNSLQAPSEGGSYHIADCCPDSASTSPRSGRITGRLLAGYGLNTLEAPFRLSAKAHRKILREGTDGWIEYRKSDAQENEFARGYARSFYTGSTAQHIAPSPRRSSAPDASNGSSNDTMAAQADGGAVGVGVGVRKSVSTTAKGKTGRNRNKSSSPPVNRGIVFAAYRRPRGHGGTVHSSKAELDALEREAETLVELILDFHQGRRRWELYQEAMRASE